MGKRKVISEDELSNMVLPEGSDVLGIAEKLLGFGRVLVKCQDDHQRLCRIRGKMKRRVWIRQGDISTITCNIRYYRLTNNPQAPPTTPLNL